jgi:hypothetical protein
MEPADGLPVELLDFDVVEQSPEEGGESERAERASIR